jgi:hypothetical protein
VVNAITKPVLLLALLTSSFAPCWAQQPPDVTTYLKKYVGLSDEQIAEIRAGKPLTKALDAPKPSQIFVFGAVYIKATPEDYVKLSTDFARLKKEPGNLAIAPFSSPPQLADLNGFTFEKDTLDLLKECEPGSCKVQMPESSMQEIGKSINWSDPQAADKVNQLLQQTALKRLLAYQQGGDRELGIYNDQKHPTVVAQKFRALLSYSRALPEYLPEMRDYLTSYPTQAPANIQDRFYWSKIEFGLRPTLRVVHVVTLHGGGGDPVAYAIAEKQLYASHYFQTLIEFVSCFRDTSKPDQRGFYLIKVMGSEQAGLTGMKGSIIRKKAVSRSADALKKSLAGTKAALEGSQ